MLLSLIEAKSITSPRDIEANSYVIPCKHLPLEYMIVKKVISISYGLTLKL